MSTTPRWALRLIWHQYQLRARAAIAGQFQRGTLGERQSSAEGEHRVR